MISPSPSSTLTVTLVDGTQVVVPDSLEQMTSYVLQEQGDWFEDEIKFLRRLVQPGQTVLDIGANVGVYALSLARKVGPNGQVWAFEPGSASADLLEASITANGTTWLQLQRQALSDHTGTAWLQTPGQSELNSLAADQQGPGEEVPLTTLDACLEQFGWQQVDLLKIDAEGEEERILAGGQRFFSELSPLVMFELKAGTELHMELVERFQELAYDCFRLVPGLDVLIPFDPSDGVDDYLLNLFAAKTDRANWLRSQGHLVSQPNPLPPKPTQLGDYHWSKSIRSRPYAKEFAERWEASLRDQRQTNNLNQKALSFWAFAMDATQPIDNRLGSLQRSYRYLERIWREKGQTSYGMSLTRVANALGKRAVAVKYARDLILQVTQGHAACLAEPFLPPSKGYEEIPTEGHEEGWALSSLLETMEMIGSYSGFFTPIESKARLERIERLGFGRSDNIKRRLRMAGRRLPQSPSFYTQAWELIRAGDLGNAKKLLKQAESAGENDATSLFYRAASLEALGYRTEAIDILQQLVELNPEEPSYLVQLGTSLKAARQKEEAELVLQQAILLYGLQLSFRPASSRDFANLGIAYDELGHKDDALDVLDRALQLEESNQDALLRKGSILERLGRHDEAIEVYEQLVRKNPRSLVALVKIAYLLMRYGELGEAKRLLLRSIELSPRYREAHHMVAFLYSISGRDATQEMLDSLMAYWHPKGIEIAQAGRPNNSVYRKASPSSGSKLHVGILTAEMGDHVVSLFLEPFLQHYDHSEFQIELVELRRHETARADYLRSMADGIHCLQDLPLDIAQAKLKNLGFDIIVETTGLTKNSGLEILAERCAPVQCHYIGYHASTGLRTIDWFIADWHTVPSELSKHFSEQVWRLNRLWIGCTHHPNLPAHHYSHSSMVPILGSFNQFSKVREETLRYWLAALNRIPDAELHLKNFFTQSERTRNRIRNWLASHGISSTRIHFLKKAPNWLEHMACYQGIDVALDTTPWSGATTTFEALSMGVPVVAIEGDVMAARMSSSIVDALGHPEWSARNPEEFAETVARLVSDLSARREGRTALRDKVKASPLFDGVDLTRHLEAALKAMAQKNK